MTVRVLVVDDEPLLRAGLAALLDSETGISVVGTAAGGAEAVDAARRTVPDVVLMDLHMEPVDGVEATRRIIGLDWRTSPRPRVLVLTVLDHDQSVLEALRAGAVGYLLKSATVEEVGAAIRDVAAGVHAVSPQVVARLVRHVISAAPPRPEVERRVSALNDTLREILALSAAGVPEVAIGRLMDLTPSTVRTYTQRVVKRLEVQTRIQAVALAHEAGIVGDRHRQLAASYLLDPPRS